MYICSWKYFKKKKNLQLDAMQGLVPSLFQPLSIFLQPGASISGLYTESPESSLCHYHGETISWMQKIVLAASSVAVDA